MAASAPATNGIKLALSCGASDSRPGQRPELPTARPRAKVAGAKRGRGKKAAAERGSDAEEEEEVVEAAAPKRKAKASGPSRHSRAQKAQVEGEDEEVVEAAVPKPKARGRSRRSKAHQVQVGRMGRLWGPAVGVLHSAAPAHCCHNAACSYVPSERLNEVAACTCLLQPLLPMLEAFAGGPSMPALA